MTQPAAQPPTVPLQVVLAEGLLAQFPGLSRTAADRVAAALAYDLAVTGWVRAPGPAPPTRDQE